MAKISRSERSKANKLAWQKREPPPRKKLMTRTQLQVLRQEAWRLGRRLGAGDLTLPDINASFTLPAKPPTFSGQAAPEEE